MSVLAAIIVGAVVGMGLGQGFGAWAGAALGWLIVRSVRQERLIAALQAAVDAARARELAAPPAKPVPPFPAEPTPAPFKDCAAQ